MVKTSELIPTHGLTRSRRQFLRLKADIEQNGVRETIKFVTFQGGRYVVDGHHRLQAARELKLLQVPAEEVELPFLGYESADDLFNTDTR